MGYSARGGREIVPMTRSYRCVSQSYKLFRFEFISQHRENTESNPLTFKSQTDRLDER